MDFGTIGPDLAGFIAVGFIAQLIDGTLGMAFGVTASSPHLSAQ